MEINKLDFINSDFTFLDIGGGNGIFTDKILETYPNSYGYLLDNSQSLLDINKEHPRKFLVNASAESLPEVFSDKKFDIIFMNLFLHHCVTNTFSDTLVTQRKMLETAHSLLDNNGRLVVF